MKRFLAAAVVLTGILVPALVSSNSLILHGEQRIYLPGVTAKPSQTTVPSPIPTSPSSPGSRCGESMDHWHPAVISNCTTGHEHGDPPPQWVMDAGYVVMFHGHFNTSAGENSAKHAAMKGFSAHLNGVDLYFRVHMASNVLDRSARYHSYEVWARDSQGGVSHWQGWTDFGDPELDRSPAHLPDPQRRPIVFVVNQASLDAGQRCETWYSKPGAPEWGWDYGWTICGSTTIYYEGENQQLERELWRLMPNGNAGTTRRLEASWFSSRPHPTGKFYATQFGELVSGPADARCSDTTTKYGATYVNTCLEQFIAPTMEQVSFPGNAEQKDFVAPGLEVPN